MSTLRAAFARGYFRFQSVVSSVFVRDIALRGVAILLLAAIVLPGIVIEATPRVKAASKPEVRPVNAPPEPFRVNSRNLGEKYGLRHALNAANEYLSRFLSDAAAAAPNDPQDPAVGTAETQQMVPSSSPANSADQQETAQVPDGEDSSEVAAEAESAEVPTIEESDAEPAALTQPSGTVDFDFDGDGKSDIGRWHPATKEFKVKKSNGGTFLTVTFSSAASSAKPAPADYDGDGKTDPAVFDAGTWYVNESTDNNPATITTVSSFGQAGDVPMSGDYRGNGDDELAVYRPSTGYWYWREFGNATVYNLQWGGTAGDIAAPGDYDADGKMDWTIYRASTGYWWVLFNNSSGYTAFPWGISIDIPVQADYDDDGKTDPAVYRPSTGQWWYLKSSTSYSTYGAITFGNPGDQPAVGDYDGDGAADQVVFRPVNGRWHIFPSITGVSTSDSLGQDGDTAVPSSYVQQVGGGVTPDAINTARLKAVNATGGTDLYSQNFGWSRGLVSLPGRSGMDLNLGISYNSLVWTKVGSTMLFDPDNNLQISPGFNIGFPTIEPAYVNGDTSEYSYLMVTPGGSRVEFRQTNGASNVYETADSSYAQLTTTGASSPLDPVEGITITVVTTDGTQMSYEWEAGAFRCKQIKDRNGNFITIAYDAYDQGLLESITDTLGRVVTFNSPNGYLSTIIQTWKTNNGADDNATHTYATLTYTTKTIAHDFHDSLAVWGPYNGTELRVLDKVTYADGSFTKFHYNGYGQVWKVEEHAADSGGTAHVLNHVRTNIESPSADQTDVPRFTQVWNKVENFNSDSETTATITRTTGQSYTSPAGGSAMTATKIEVAMSSHPHNAISKSWYGESGWKDGLPLATEDWADGSSGSERKRWTLSSYTQDDTGAMYQTNPRVTETKVGDGTNTKRTTVDYVLYESSTIAAFGLPAVVKVYDTDQTSVLRETTTTYNFDSNLISRRIAGLPLTVEVEGYNQLTSSSELVSKVTYAYDEGNFSDTSLVQSVSPTQWDSTNYGTGFSYRGNLTSTTRWDVTQPTTSAAAVTSTTKYNTAGSPVAQISPWDGSQTRTVRIGYADNFNSSPGVTTNAYPTVMTDPAGSSIGASGHSSTIKYRYDIGANVEAESPAPAGQTYGKKSKRVFDSVGRLEKDSIYVNTTEKSYTRYEYPTNGVQSKVYRPIVDADNDGNIAEDEVYTEGWFDGAGRVRQSRTEHPGSTGGWASTFVEYDILGRVKRQSVPTETNSSFSPTGDDSAGALWTHFKYDWMGRVVRKINTDGVDDPTLNDSDVLYTYQGCGCAGGLVTTIQGESTEAKDISGTLQTDKRRYQTIYEDILGRTAKTELWDLDGAGSEPYTTNEMKYDGASRVVRSRKYAGSTSSSTYQETTSSFDGHGRLATSHIPQQDAGRNTSYTYNPDGTVLTMTDARGAVTNYEYNAQGLVGEKSYTAPSSNDYLFPEIEKVTKNSSTVLKVTGQNFESNVEVLVFQNSGEAVENLATYSGSELTVGTESGKQTLTFEMTESNVLSSFVAGHLWIQVINPTTGRGSPKSMHLLAPHDHPEWWLVMGLSDLDRTTETFEYDSLGNPTEINDGAGELTFAYDSLSRVTSETRATGVSVPTATYNLASGLALSTYTIGYQYTLSGQLKKITDPFSKETNYVRDKVGRLTDVTGTTFASQSNFIDDQKYRAFGATKQMTYGTSLVMNQTFDSRLRPASYDLTRYSTTLVHKEYEYLPDGNLKYSEDGGGSGNQYDRLYTRDFAGRITDAKSGAEARGQTPSPAGDRPYLQSFEYDHFNNVTELNSETWTTPQSGSPTHTYDPVTNRETTMTGGWLQEPVQKYDADGRQGYYDWGGYRSGERSYDGKHIASAGTIITLYDENGFDYTEQRYDFKYYSSVLGGRLLNEVNLLRTVDVYGGTHLSGTQKTYVQADGQTIATQKKQSQHYDSMSWEHMDPSRATYASSSIVEGNFYGGRSAELDPMGSNAGTYAPEPIDWSSPWLFPGFGSTSSQVCYIDGVQELGGCQTALRMLANGSADLDGVGDMSTPIPPGIFPFWEDGTEYIPGQWAYRVYDDFAALPADRKKEADTTLRDLISFLKDKASISKDCRKNVLEKLTKKGLDLDKFISFLEKGADFYDGDASTAELGPLLASEQMTQGPPSPGYTVSQFFRQGNGELFNALTSGTASKTRLTIFFDNKAVLTKGLTFHEALHGFGFFTGSYKGKLDDPALKDALDIDAKKASREIEDLINKHCFPGQK